MPLSSCKIVIIYGFFRTIFWDLLNYNTLYISFFLGNSIPLTHHILQFPDGRQKAIKNDYIVLYKLKYSFLLLYKLALSSLPVWYIVHIINLH